MRPFDELTNTGRAARVRMLAADTLRNEFGIQPRRVSLLAAHSFNTIFRADLDDGSRAAVRVGEVRIHADRVEEVEGRWLGALRAETAMHVPAMTPDRRGRYVTAGTHPLVPSQRFCSVISWVPGTTARQRFDHDTARRVGAMLAEIHEHASSYAPPEIPAGIRADRVVYFGDTSRLAALESTYGTMFVEAIHRVQAHLDALWGSLPHRPHLLHGDFGPHNIMRWRSRLTPIDFQDLLFGFDLQDVAITVCDLRRQFADESLVGSLKNGYRSVRPWPLEDLVLERALAAGRSLNVINLGLNLRRPGLQEFFGRHASLVQQWMAGLAPKATLI